MLSEHRRSQLTSGLTIVLALALVIAVAVTIYIALFPPETSSPFTEYYILGPDGNASGYPTELEPNEAGVVVVGITNHEHGPVDYRSVVSWNDTATRSYNLTLPDGETNETRLRLVAPSEPGRYNVSLRLYKGDSDTPDERLRLLVTVSANGPSQVESARSRPGNR